MDVINSLPAFLLIFVRLIALWQRFLFSHTEMFRRTSKLGCRSFFALIVLLTIDVPDISLDGSYFLLIIKEVMVGLLLGLIASMLFYAIQVAGAFIDLKIGFLVANVIDPQTGAQSPLTGGFLYAFAILFLLATNGHHLLLDGMFYSFSYVPIEVSSINITTSSVLETAVEAFVTMFLIAFLMSFPIVGSLFLVDVALGMMSRAVPQMNVFVVGLPLKIIIGLPIMMITMPAFFYLLRNLTEEMAIAMRTMMQLFGGA